MGSVPLRAQAMDSAHQRTPLTGKAHLRESSSGSARAQESSTGKLDGRCIYREDVSSCPPLPTGTGSCRTGPCLRTKVDTESSACLRGKGSPDLSPEVEADSPRRGPGGEASLFTPGSWAGGPTVCPPGPFEDLQPVFEADLELGRAPRTPTC